MVEYLEKHRRVFLLSGISICIIAIIFTISPNIGKNILSSGVSRIIAPVQRGINATAAWVGSHFSALTNNQRLITMNRELQAEVNRLEFENFRLSLAAEENAMLNAALNMHNRYAHLSTMGARVIGQDPSDRFRSFHIDRGANDGVQMSMAIIADGGLAGVVRYVNPTRAQFVSVLDSRFAAHVVSPRTEDVGTARGDTRLMSQGLLRMEHIEASAQIIPGDQILTSSSSSIFPAGLLVGEVVSVHTNPDGLTRYAIIKPAANVAELDVVLVVTEGFGEVGFRDTVDSEE
ncbi:MAG: rod shape-determining protein MreC [Defluviitaleaceae bacterium]|nr:rod shape-determining protein MreC [Defluviitaleaceae bacterium]